MTVSFRLSDDGLAHVVRPGTINSKCSARICRGAEVTTGMPCQPCLSITAQEMTNDKKDN